MPIPSPSTIRSNGVPGKGHTGLAHFALSVGSENEVDETTQQLKDQGFQVVGPPRRTGDGYYESVALDPEGNRIGALRATARKAARLS